MNLYDLLLKAEKDDDVPTVIDRNTQVIDLAKRINASLRKINEALKERTIVFYNNLRSSNLSLSVGATLSEYAANRIASPCQDAEKEAFEKLPTLIASLLAAPASDPKHVDKSIVELFFQYENFDPAYKKLPIEQLPQRIAAFNSSMLRLRRFFRKGTPPFVYEGLVRTRDNAYGSDWDAMITDLQKRRDEEDKKDTNRDPLKLDEFSRAIVQCRMLRRFEKQERISLTHLLKISDSLYSALDLEHTVNFYNNLRTTLPPNVSTSLIEYIASRVTLPLASESDQKEIEKLPGITGSILERGQPSKTKYDPKIVELFFRYARLDPAYSTLAASEIPEAIERFNSAIQRFKKFYTDKETPINEFEKIVGELNLKYKGSWEEMMRGLQEELIEARKAGAGEELQNKIRRCQFLQHYEEQGGLQFVYFSKMAPFVYKVLAIKQ